MIPALGNSKCPNHSIQYLSISSSEQGSFGLRIVLKHKLITSDEPSLRMPLIILASHVVGDVDDTISLVLKLISRLIPLSFIIILI